ncbi:hypothetical protein [Streptomyces sp. Root369]|uniref:hypothetical protein n=1 Tax=Streptomyces sp. Root369 TaxID=1736523 RepID=UPI00070BF5CB|nr:hypothetical protein [Streptomyces sp. Root369]KQW13547.1 hypothetical protein ASD08_30755 [Streptomyces sp. Root369]
MDATTALHFLTIRANAEAEAAETARQKLAEACAVKGSQLTYLMEAAMVADAHARPWVDLFLRIERLGVREGLAKMRAEATEALVSYGIALSTSMVTNAERLYEQEGLRRFLSATNGMDIEDEAPVEEAAPAAEEQPAPAPAPVDVPKATEAQRRTLLAIRDCLIELQEVRVGQVRVVSNRFDVRPRRDMVEWVIGQGWAARDTSTSLFQGQKVSLAEVGTAILAS